MIKPNISSEQAKERHEKGVNKGNIINMKDKRVLQPAVNSKGSTLST
jgi:hypothetical protein